MAIQKDLPINRLATTDKTGKRVYIYPSEVRGHFRKLRNWVYTALMLVFLGLPWIKVHGLPAVFLDLPNRRFTFFGTTLWAHEAPILVFIFGGAALTLFFVTAVLGRMWCGWACPQTVFIDVFFRRIEGWIEGDALARRALDEAPWTTQKYLKRAVKWALFVCVSLLISHSFLAYFVSVDELMRIVFLPPSQNWLTFVVMAIISSLVLFDFGWFREQFCIIACPYGRFQSVLMDSRSLAVLYDYHRGEPRKNSAEADKAGSHADCVNCYRCVQVCPTGIDIRRGVQMECVACTSCIDACDDVMTRIGKPKGLIRYDSELGIEGKLRDVKRALLTPRSWVYLTIIGVVCSGLVYVLSQRKTLDVTLTRAHETPYMVGQQSAQGREIINHLRFDFNNLSVEAALVKVVLDSGAIAQGAELIMPVNPIAVPPGQSIRSDFFVKFPDKLLSLGRGKVSTQITGTYLTRPEVQLGVEVGLVGPF